MPPPIINVFIAIFDQFNVFLLKNKKLFLSKKRSLTDPKHLNSCVIGPHWPRVLETFIHFLKSNIINQSDGGT